VYGCGIWIIRQEVQQLLVQFSDRVQRRESATDAKPTTTAKMQLPLISCGLLACLIAQVSATALTYKLQANEKACFYTSTKTKGEKIAFYFAVRTAT